MKTRATTYAIITTLFLITACEKENPSQVKFKSGSEEHTGHIHDFLYWEEPPSILAIPKKLPTEVTATYGIREAEALLPKDWDQEAEFEKFSIDPKTEIVTAKDRKVIKRIGMSVPRGHWGWDEFYRDATSNECFLVEEKEMLRRHQLTLKRKRGEIPPESYEETQRNGEFPMLNHLVEMEIRKFREREITKKEIRDRIKLTVDEKDEEKTRPYLQE